MVLYFLRNISDLLQESTFPAVMIDEMTDIANPQEQVVIEMHRTDASFEVCEEFWGLYAVSCIDAASLFTVIKDTMLYGSIYPRTNFKGNAMMNVVL